jgi:hypothetical protein
MQHGTADLRYRLLRGPTDLAPLRVLACRSFAWAGWEVRAVILGASHAVVFRRGSEERAELLTCLPPPLNGETDALLTLAVPPDMNASEAALPSDWLPDGATGAVRLSRFPLDGGDSLRGDFAPGSTLSFDFPVIAGATTPRTRVGWRADGAALFVETVHTYPEEQWGVRSETRITAEAGR